MKRRSFLQLLGLAPIAPIIKIPPQEQPPITNEEYTLEEARKLLQKEWGNNFDENIAIARCACRDMNLMEVMGEPPLFGNNPEVIKCFHKIGKKLRG